MTKTSVEWLGKELESYGDPGYCKIEWETLDLLIQQAKEMEKEQMINFALYRDDYLEKANTLEDFTIPNEDLVKLFKQQEQ
jgi:hypothetical protein